MSRTALITGAAGRIGRELCAKFNEDGYYVLAIDRQGDPGVYCGAYLQLDLASALLGVEETERTMILIRQYLKKKRLDVLINNAADQILGRTADLTREQWSSTISTNLNAPFFLTQALLPELEAAGGNVVNVASIHAQLTKPGFVAYATSKAALVGLTRALAVDLGARVRVNSVSPAAVDTPMLRQGFSDDPDAMSLLHNVHPIGRIGKASDVAALVHFLASENASFITGANITLDGGISSRLHDPA